MASRLDLSQHLCIPFKQGTTLDLGPPLIRYISEVYEQQGSDYGPALASLTKLRGRVLHPQPREEVLDQLTLYASQLVFTQARFYKASRLPNLQFAWSNTFDASPQTNTDIRFEQAAVLYNIAAVACNLAQQRFKGSETDEQDLKQSLKWYKTAAQAATSLLSLVPELGLTGDLSLAAISVLQPLLAAQTYECSLVKAIKAGMKPATIARIATQIASLYDQAHTAVLPLPVGKTHPWQAWQPCLQAKTLRARGLAQYYQSKFSEASSEWGEEVARLRLAVELLRNVEQAIPQGRDAIVDISSLKPLLSEVQARLTKAEDDNNVIYHEAVPSETALVEVTAVELFSIGPLGMQESVDMLSTLLPLEAHLAASELSEAKSQLLRKAQHDVEEQDAQLQHALDAMALDKDTNALAVRTDLPADVFTKGSMLRDESQQTPAHLADVLEEYAETLRKFDRRFMSVTAQLDHVVDLASPKLKQERADMEQSLRQTGDSLKALKQGLSTAVPSLQLLASSHDELKAAMPQASLLEVDLMEQDESKHARIRDLLAKVKLMRQLRADKLAELRRAAGAVDIRSKLLTGGDKSGLITAAMAPLEALVGQLESNFESQAKLLPVMVEVYGSQGQARKQVANVVQQQERFIEQLLSAFASYQSLTKKTSSMAAFIAAFASRLQALEQQADQLSAAQAVAPVQRRPKKSPPKAPNHRHTIAGLPAGDLLSGPLTGQATSLSPTRRSVLMDPELNDDLLGLLAATSTDELGPSPLDVATEALAKQLEKLAVQTRDNKTGFEKEFELLKFEDETHNKVEKCSVAQRNPDRNRYKDILPYDRTRLRMELSPGYPPTDDYINACKVKLLTTGAPDFVCAQGPKHSTGGDFWKMIVQQRSRVIVMVTNLIENGRLKCDQYWPEPVGETQQFAATALGCALDVTCQSMSEHDGWVERTFLVESYQETQTVRRKVTQFHYTAWPDRGVPQSPDHFLAFLFAVKGHHDKVWKESQTAGEPQSPITVHCSAGVGRTGTFCAIYGLVCAFPLLGNGLPLLPARDKSTARVASTRESTSAKIDIMSIVSRMREDRRHMVQTLAQYEFCYRCGLQAAQDFVAREGHMYRRRQRTLVPVEAPAPGVQDPSAMLPGDDTKLTRVARRATASLSSGLKNLRRRASRAFGEGDGSSSPRGRTGSVGTGSPDKMTSPPVLQATATTPVIAPTPTLPPSEPIMSLSLDGFDAHSNPFSPTVSSPSSNPFPIATAPIHGSYPDQIAEPSNPFAPAAAPTSQGYQDRPPQPATSGYGHQHAPATGSQSSANPFPSPHHEHNPFPMPTSAPFPADVPSPTNPFGDQPHAFQPTPTHGYNPSPNQPYHSHTHVAPVQSQRQEYSVPQQGHMSFAQQSYQPPHQPSPSASFPSDMPPSQGPSQWDLSAFGSQPTASGNPAQDLQDVFGGGSVGSPNNPFAPQQQQHPPYQQQQQSQQHYQYQAQATYPISNHQQPVYQQPSPSNNPFAPVDLLTGDPVPSNSTRSLMD